MFLHSYAMCIVTSHSPNLKVLKLIKNKNAIQTSNLGALGPEGLEPNYYSVQTSTDHFLKMLLSRIVDSPGE